MAHSVSAETPTPRVAADRWTAYSVTVWAICMLGFAFDIYEATIMQLVTPLLIKEWGIAPATIGNITTVSRSGCLEALTLEGPVTDFALVVGTDPSCTVCWSTKRRRRGRRPEARPPFP